MLTARSLSLCGMSHSNRCTWMQPEEAAAKTLEMIRVYEDVAVNLAAMPVVAGRKSRLESFAGANATYTIEGMMGDKRALQVISTSTGSSD